MILFHCGYNIERRGETYVARSSDGDNHKFELSSKNMLRILNAINALWLSASQIHASDSDEDTLVAPRWLREWLNSSTDFVDLDTAYRRGAC